MIQNVFIKYYLLNIKLNNLVLILKQIINHLQNFKEFEIVIKIHPGLDLHSLEIKKIIKKINSNIPIYQNISI